MVGGTLDTMPNPVEPSLRDLVDRVLRNVLSADAESVANGEENWVDNDISPDLVQPVFDFLMAKTGDVLVSSVNDMPEQMSEQDVSLVQRRQIALRVALQVVDAMVADAIESMFGFRVEDETFNLTVASYLAMARAARARDPGKEI